MFKELFTSIKGALYELALSPLAGTFCLVWLAFNWKGVAYLFFQTGDIASRIKTIESTYADPAMNYLLPAITTIAFLLLYPLLAAAAFYWSERLEGWQRKTRHRFALHIPLSPQESLELRQRLDEAEKRLSDMILGKEKRVAELEAVNQKLSDENTALRPKASPEDLAQAKELATQLEQLRSENAELRGLSEKLTLRYELRSTLRESEVSQKMNAWRQRKYGAANFLNCPPRIVTRLSGFFKTYLGISRTMTIQARTA